MGAPKQNVINGWNARERSATVRIDRVQDLVRKHEPGVEHSSAPLIEMGMYDASAKTVTHRHDQHGPFIRPKTLASDNGLGVRNQVAMADHHQPRHAGGARGGH